VPINLNNMTVTATSDDDLPKDSVDQLVRSSSEVRQSVRRPYTGTKCPAYAEGTSRSLDGMRISLDTLRRGVQSRFVSFFRATVIGR